LLVIAILIMASTAGNLLPARGADLDLEPQPLSPANPLNFEESVKIALRQSPYLIKSSLEIDIRRLDETDSRYEMIPNVTFRTYYYVNRGTTSFQNFSNRPYFLSFTADDYNPVTSYFTLQARKLATQAAILIHLKLIADGLERLGRYYLELGALHRLEATQKQLIGLNQESLTYIENRFSMGTATSLEVKVARQELQLARNEEQRLELSRQRVMANLKGFLGIKSAGELIPDLKNVRGQVLGTFDPLKATLEQAKDHSYELKALKLKKKLQNYNVKMAVAKIFPSLLFTAQTPDPLSLNNVHGIYAGIGLQVPVWDGFTRVRNISRQKILLREIDAEKTTKESDMEDTWLTVQGDFQNAAQALNLAQDEEDLARLKARQNEIRYQSGNVPLPVALEGRKKVLEAQKNQTLKLLDYEKAALTLRNVSGDLGQTYVKTDSLQP
jgi:outer membrane protein TolC